LKKLSKSFYTSIIISGCVWVIVFVFAYGIKGDKNGIPDYSFYNPYSLTFANLELFFFITGGVTILFFFIVFNVLIYKMWSAIQSETVKITPGKAVGRLYIPIYQLFWMFKVFP
jgi:hypothetical protein